MSRGYDESSDHPFDTARSGPYASRSYKGRGPKGYRRSDSRLMEEICERLTHHRDIDASDVEVDVQDAVIRLSGRVPERMMKHLAEDLASDISGVQGVKNEIAVVSETYRHLSTAIATGVY